MAIEISVFSAIDTDIIRLTVLILADIIIDITVEK
jgi:hypothetical protein